jgi:phosphatidate cytidylyltransferase
MILVCLIGQFELFGMLGKEQKYRPVLEWPAGIAIMCSAHFYAERGILFAFAFSLAFLMIFTVVRGLRGDGYKRFTLGVFSLLYLPFCLSFFYLLSLAKDGQLLFIILASVWALDMGAYAFGMTLRGPRLSPGISPNKTISGALGGALMRYLGFIEISELRFWLLAFSVAIVGQIADLFESVLKRESEIKDSGALLGAHGGILDRIDSVLFLGPVCYALIVI